MFCLFFLLTFCSAGFVNNAASFDLFQILLNYLLIYSLKISLIIFESFYDDIEMYTAWTSDIHSIDSVKIH